MRVEGLPSTESSGPPLSRLHRLTELQNLQLQHNKIHSIGGGGSLTIFLLCQGRVLQVAKASGIGKGGDD